jgi:hypothetical protein
MAPIHRPWPVNGLKTAVAHWFQRQPQNSWLWKIRRLAWRHGITSYAYSYIFVMILESRNNGTRGIRPLRQMAHVLLSGERERERSRAPNGRCHRSLAMKIKFRARDMVRHENWLVEWPSVIMWLWLILNLVEQPSHSKILSSSIRLIMKNNCAGEVQQRFGSQFSHLSLWVNKSRYLVSRW